MFNPFKEIFEEDKCDQELVSQSVEGERKALESLVLRHQSWIYNIAIRMVCDPHDAEDITQDVLIKIITKLSTFNSEKASFRTWLYRIVVNHIINVKKREKELFLTDFVRKIEFSDFVSQVPDKRSLASPESELLAREIKASCVQCMLLCLNRKERMIFILGVIFNITDSMGSDICDISKDNFRKILSRSRKKIYHFFEKNCSLLNEDNPCVCSNNYSSMLKFNLIDPDNLLIKSASLGNISEMISNGIANLEDSYYEFHSLFKDQPFLKSPDMKQWFHNLFERDHVKDLFNMH